MRALAGLTLLWVAACSHANPNGGRDLGGGGTICPAHPQNCSGTCCGDVCVETENDDKNCGACGQECPMGTKCAAGRCGCPPTNIVCGMGQSCCGMNGCKSLDSDQNNCGVCGVFCGREGVCVGGECHCGSTVCQRGQQCCSGACSNTACIDPTDMAVPTQPLCTCDNAPFGPCLFSMQCVGMDCCAFDSTFGFCTAGGCTTQKWPP